MPDLEAVDITTHYETIGKNKHWETRILVWYEDDWMDYILYRSQPCLSQNASLADVQSWWANHRNEYLTPLTKIWSKELRRKTK